MTHLASYAEPDESPILHAAIALAPRIAESSEKIEQERRTPTSIVKALKSAGVFGMAMPHTWGGPGRSKRFKACRFVRPAK
jgi:alkylation response protein AidB-like acyl-CoA dehydrogenase